MNKDTINLPRLISLIAEGASVSPATARRFLHDLFAYIEERLTAGETVNIKGIGEFVNSGDPSNPVLFKADEELAAIANEPFSVFSAVTLNEEAVDEIEAVGKKDEENVVEGVATLPVVEPVLEKSVEVEEAAENAHVEEPKQAPVVVPTEVEADNDEAVEESEPVQNDADVAEEPLAADQDKEPEQNPNPETYSDAATIEQPENAADVSVEDEVKPERRYAQAPGYRRSARRSGMAHVHKSQSSYALWLVLGILIGLILGLVGGYFAGKTMAAYELPEENDYSIFDEVDADTIALSAVPIVSDSTVMQDTAHQKAVASIENKEIGMPAKEEPVSAKKTEPVYDTITSTRYLSILARDHYGVKNYWIFIYEANPQLGNPNQIRPGTRVLIPPKESFQEATKAETDAKARRLLNQLAKKYKF